MVRVLSVLLIVPYGIETDFFLCVAAAVLLLIVPYGIETAFPLLWCSPHLLLIVPYGIETQLAASAVAGERPFNRTLWN